MNNIKITKEMYVPKVGMSSLIGHHVLDVNYPLLSGNYCALWDGPYLVNCWAENLEEWARRNPEVNEIEVTVIECEGFKIGIVTDERMKGWCNEKLCVTGHGWGNVRICRKACEICDVDVKKYLCGCEKDDEDPLISVKGSFNTGFKKTCYRCGRQWDHAY